MSLEYRSVRERESGVMNTKYSGMAATQIRFGCGLPIVMGVIGEDARGFQGRSKGPPLLQRDLGVFQMVTWAIWGRMLMKFSKGARRFHRVSKRFKGF